MSASAPLLCRSDSQPRSSDRSSRCRPGSSVAAARLVRSPRSGASRSAAVAGIGWAVGSSWHARATIALRGLRRRRGSGRALGYWLWRRRRPEYLRPMKIPTLTSRRSTRPDQSSRRRCTHARDRPVHLRSGSQGVEREAAEKSACRRRQLREQHRRDRAGVDAMGIGPGDEVIARRSRSTHAEAIARRGAAPVFAEIDPATLNLDPADVERRITERTKALMPVHLFGRPAADFSGLGLPVIEDAAQAFGAGGIATSIASTFSFFPTKNLFALGDGGLISVNDAELAQRLRMLRFHGGREGILTSATTAPRRHAGRVPTHLPSSSRRLNASRREAAAQYTELPDGSPERRRTRTATSTMYCAFSRA